MLELCERVLAPTGIAYISYNTYPGWHLRQMLAEMMRFHTSGTEDPEAAVTEGLGLVQAVGRTLGEESPYAKAILSEMERIVRRNKSITFHDDLNPEMEPLLFTDFIKKARAHGLQFLAEADYTTMVYEDLPADARSALEEIRDDAVRREQYLDFFKLRRLRETLLCRADLTVLPEASSGAFDVLYFGVPLEPKTVPDYSNESPVEFLGQRSMAVTVAQPFVKAEVRRNFGARATAPSATRCHRDGDAFGTADENVWSRPGRNRYKPLALSGDCSGTAMCESACSFPGKGGLQGYFTASPVDRS
jgi:hypothetical protein